MDYVLTRFSVVTIVLILVSGSAIRKAPESREQICLTYTLQGILHVDCSEKNLDDLPDSVDNQVQKLILAINNFEIFPEGLEYFSRIETLDLSSNHIVNRQLPNYFKNLTKLHTLNLSNNAYETWFSTENKYNLRKLDLSKNKISLIEEFAFKAMPYLHHLDLSENRIYELPSRIFSEEYNNLDVLILSRNYFSNVPRFQSFSLRSLHLSNCQIASLSEDSFSSFPYLLEIDLSLNLIEYVPESLSSSTLQALNLAYNKISTLTDQSFSALPHLAVLDLRGNEFKDVWSPTVFNSNHFLREVHVKGNRWSCEDFSVNLLMTYEYLTKDPAKVTDSSLICYSPSNVTHLTWQEAYLKTKHPQQSTENLSFISVMIGVILGILVTSFACRGLMALNRSDDTSRPTAVTNANGTTLQPRVETVVMRVPLSEDLPPTYDEALLMPRLNTSFHSLPDFVDEEDPHGRQQRRSRSIGDLTEHRPQGSDRRSVRRTVEIRINDDYT